MSIKLNNLFFKQILIFSEFQLEFFSPFSKDFLLDFFRKILQKQLKLIVILNSNLISGRSASVSNLVQCPSSEAYYLCMLPLFYRAFNILYL